MTTLAAIAICYGVFMLVVWAICVDSKRRDNDAIDAARRIHPSTLPPGVALVRETEDYLRRRLR